MSPKETKYSLNGTHIIHGDAIVRRSESSPVAPSISVTTSFKAPNPLEDLTPYLEVDLRNPSRHVYSRYTQDTSTRVEHVLSHITNGYALSYASGLAASYAALVFFQPKRIAISGGYHGAHATIEVFRKNRGAEVTVIGIDDEFQAGDLCWLETPLNPTGESRDIKYYADKVHGAGGKIIVDSTFAPPPLQEPFKWGADCILHSGTKYFGGHSDLLSGVLVVKTVDEWKLLHTERTFLGSMMGSLESWLLLRSLKTLHLRIPRQSETATALAQWLNSTLDTPLGQSNDGVPGGIITKVWHSSLQKKDARGFDPKEQMTGGWNATFAILLATGEQATLLPWSLKYFTPATSLGGVESLIEQRVQSDSGADPRLIRISVGVEDLKDLQEDLRNGLQKVAKVQAKL